MGVITWSLLNLWVSCVEDGILFEPPFDDVNVICMVFCLGALLLFVNIWSFVGI